MKRVILLLPMLILSVLVVNQAMGQEDIVDRLSVAFSDPGKPGVLEVGLVNGGIAVTGYDGREVVVEAKTRMKKISRRKEERAEGLIHIPVATTGLTVEEEENVMEIGTDSWKHTIDLEIQVPINTSLKLHCVNHGDIKVENVNGEIEVNNVNGKVTLLDISGAVVAHALNKDLVVTMKEILPDKAMSFSTLNGDIDVVFPPDLRANVKLKADNGDVYSDFEIQLSREPKQVVEENTRDRGGKYKVRIDRTINGTINGGGQEILFKSFQGDIFIRKGE
jgi:DUF4097 and DUF4098 domain-containing protein YvlB